MKKLTACVLAIALAAATLTGCGEKNDAYTVGICQLVQHPALDLATEGFKDALKDKLGDKVVFVEQNASGEAANCITIANQFVSDKVDLIMANATPALQAAQAATDVIPILGTSVTDYASALGIENWTGVTGTNISGTSDLAPLKDQAEMIKELFPDVQHVGIIYCSAEANSVYQAETIKSYLDEMSIANDFYAFSDSNDIASVVQKACSESDVLYVPTDNTAASATNTIDGVAQPAGVPIVAGEEGICKGCGVATLSISYYDIGYQTGLMAYEILVNGADISNMEIEFAPNVTKEYNEAICTALGITIPEGYVAIQ